jgi:hypothetical protein
MKVLQVTTSSKGGAGIAALRLHEALRSYGVDSAFLSKDLTIDFKGVQLADDFFTYRKPSLFQKVIRKVKRLFLPSREQKLQNTLRKLHPQLNYEMLSTPFSSYTLEDHPLFMALKMPESFSLTQYEILSLYFSKTALLPSLESPSITMNS